MHRHGMICSSHTDVLYLRGVYAIPWSGVLFTEKKHNMIVYTENQIIVFHSLIVVVGDVLIFLFNYFRIMKMEYE